MPHSRRGFTLIELIVVLVVVGLLVAILIPLVQRAREAARLSQCRNNLKQLGLAMHNYHDTFAVFPPGYIGEQWAEPDEGHWNWMISLAPFLESSPRYSVLSHGKRKVEQALQDPKALRYFTKFGDSTYRCPSDAGPLLNTGTTLVGERSNRQVSGQSLLLANYVAINSSGSLRRDPLLEQRGMFYRNSSVKIMDITDGISNTIMLGERAWRVRGAQPLAAVQYALGNDEPAADGLGVREGSGTRAADFAHAAQHDSGLAYCFAGGSAYLNERHPIARFGLSSVHPKGVPILLADGSVRQLSPGIQHTPDTVDPHDSVVEQLLTFQGDFRCDCADF